MEWQLVGGEVKQGLSPFFHTALARKFKTNKQKKEPQRTEVKYM